MRAPKSARSAVRRPRLLKLGSLAGSPIGAVAVRHVQRPPYWPVSSRSRSGGFAASTLPASEPFMAEITPVADAVTPVPAFEDIERAARFTREPFVAEGEDPAVILAPGSARRWALDAALAELDAGATVPSVAWRQRWSLLLGLDRVLALDEPVLADGTVLSAHQVDALSGTLTELLAEAQEYRDPVSDGALAALNGALASAGIPGEEDPGGAEPEEPEDGGERGETAAAALTVEEQPENPTAPRRFWFEHATGAGKT